MAQEFRESAKELVAASSGDWTWDEANKMLVSQRTFVVNARDSEGDDTLEGDDPACLPMAPQQMQTIEIHILFSPIWELPILFLAGHNAASGEPLSLDAILCALSVDSPRSLSITLQVSI